MRLRLCLFSINVCTYFCVYLYVHVHIFAESEAASAPTSFISKPRSRWRWCLIGDTCILRIFRTSSWRITTVGRLMALGYEGLVGCACWVDELGSFQ